MWWQDAVVYQTYPRSFQDSNGDGIGDLPGIIGRLDYVAGLGVDAIWLSPFYPSPNKDFGYDVSDYTNVSPEYGTLEDFDRLVAAARARNLKTIIDFVPCHTSVDHPWFRQRPDYYFWADAPPNNWQATFGGSAWQLDPHTGRYYLHSFFPEQADLNWRNPAVRAEMAEALRFWLDRGVDGFRLDAIDRLFKDPDLRDDPPATEPFGLPLHDDYARLSHVNSANASDIGIALKAIRDAVGPETLLIGEAYLPTAQLTAYTDTLDVVFAFEPMNAGPDAERLTRTITAAAHSGKLGWVISNHDFTRFATRFADSARAAVTLFMALPGPAFLFQGDELGTANGPGTDPPLDRNGRDLFRHPMPWTDDAPRHGFTTGTPWLPIATPHEGSVTRQQENEDSVQHLFRRLIALRRRLAETTLSFQPDTPPQTIVAERGDVVIAVNVGEEARPLKRPGQLLLEANPGDGADAGILPAHGGWVALR